MMTRLVRRSRSRGFTLVWALLAVVIVGVTATAALTAGVSLERHAAEDDLLFVGREFRNAFKSYYDATTGTQRYPRSLDDLVRDPRFPDLRRHLRRVYADPMTGSTKWGTVPSPDGGIMAVYSLSTETPIKKTNFPPELGGLESKSSYAEWQFGYGLPAKNDDAKQPAAAPAPMRQPGN